MLSIACDTEPALVGQLRCHADVIDADGFVSRWTRRKFYDVYELPHDPTRVRVRHLGTHESRDLPRSALGPLKIERKTWGKDLPDPTPVRHRSPTRPAFPAGGTPLPGDIAQGMLGSCQLLAAAAQMTRRYPQALPARMQATASTLRLRCHPDAHVEFATSDLTREEMQPGDPVVFSMSTATLAYAEAPDCYPYGACGAGSQRPLWPGLLEKAFAMTQGRRYYDPSPVAMSWLTGCRTVLRAANPRDPDALFDDMLARQAANECMTVDVRDGSAAPYPHAYEVLDVDEATRTFTLRCPASTTPPQPPHLLVLPAEALGTTVESCIYTVGAAARLSA